MIDYKQYKQVLEIVTRDNVLNTYPEISRIEVLEEKASAICELFDTEKVGNKTTLFKPLQPYPHGLEGTYVIDNTAKCTTVKCNHESDGLVYTSIPPQRKCKKCGEYYPC